MIISHVGNAIYSGPILYIELYISSSVPWWLSWIIYFSYTRLEKMPMIQYRLISHISWPCLCISSFLFFILKNGKFKVHLRQAGRYLGRWVGRYFGRQIFRLIGKLVERKIGWQVDRQTDRDVYAYLYVAVCISFCMYIFHSSYYLKELGDVCK